MKKLLITFIVFITAIDLLLGQGDLDQQQKVFFRNEKTLAILLNTDGYGGSYRSGKRIDYLNKRIIDIDFGTLKNSKEVRLSNPVYQTPGSFIFGKLNSVFFIRGGWGRQHELYRKIDLGGVAIRFFYSGGPVLTFYKPIYYKILVPVSSTEFTIVEQKFDIKKLDPTMIYGKSSFFKGFDELKVLPGIFVKSGFNFEYSKEDKVIHAIEVGAQVMAFPKKIPIMATENNKAIFLSLFASYRFGVVLDPSNPESNSIESLFKSKKK